MELRSSIVMSENLTSVLGHIISAVNMTTSAMSQMQTVADRGLDVDGITAIRDELNSATLAARQLDAQMGNIQAPEPIWQTPQSPEVFNTAGLARYQQEIQSANEMASRLASTQVKIAEQAAKTNLFPSNMVNDISAMNSRVESLRARIAEVSKQKIKDVGAQQASRAVESLRGQLSQAVRVQEELNSAASRLDVSGANQAYANLNSILDSTERNIRDNIQGQEQFNQSMRSGNLAANSLKSAIGSIAAAYLSIQGAKKVLDLSDEMTNTTARLNLMNDGLQTTKDLQNMVFAAAQRSRGAYRETADLVAKIGLNARDAFSSNQEIIAFAEQLNKQFVISGASATEAKYALIQLNQALSSGVLRGDELRSVFEQAPMLIRSIANYMNVPVGKIREMAAEGQLTAQIVKNAVLAAADETNAQFEKMPKTFAQAATKMKNNALKAFQPVLDRLSEIANSEAFMMLTNNVSGALSVVAGIVLEIFNLVAQVGKFVSDNWSLIAPIVLGVAAALGVYYGWLLLVKIAELAEAAAHGIATAAKMIAVPVYAALTGATMNATAAQWGLNTALYSCPIVWIIILVIVLVAAIYLVVAAINMVTGWTISATGVIIGCIYWLGELFKNIGLWIANVAIAIWNAIVQIGLWFADLGIGIWNTLGACANNVKIAFLNAWAEIQSRFYQFVGAVVSGVKQIANMLNSLLGVFGIKIDTSGLEASIQSFASKQSAAAGSKLNYQDIGAAWNKGYSTYKIDFGSAWSSGYNTFDVFQPGWGSNSYNAGYQIGQTIDKGFTDMFNPEGWIDKLTNGLSNVPAYGLDPNGINKGVGDTADNTKAMRDTLTASEEDLKYLRDIAEREAINRFTTAELHVDFGGFSATIHSDMDLDGVVEYIEEHVSQALEYTAEGVYV